MRKMFAVIGLLGAMLIASVVWPDHQGLIYAITAFFGAMMVYSWFHPGISVAD